VSGTEKLRVPLSKLESVLGPALTKFCRVCGRQLEGRTAIFLTLLVLTQIVGVSPHLVTVNAQDTTYKLGPIFPTSAGYTVTVQYNASISDQDIQVGNMILNEYVPRLLQYFYSPAENIVVTVHKVTESFWASAGAGNIWLGESAWRAPGEQDWRDAVGMWTHEFTHILQFSGAYPPAVAVTSQGDDTSSFYVEPTAYAMASLLDPGVPPWEDWSFAHPDIFSVGEPTRNYYDTSRGVSVRGAWIAWMSLFEADHNVVREVNARLSELGKQGLAVADMPSFRELLSESTQYEALDGLPIRQWLAVEGFLGKSELGNSATISIPLSGMYGGSPEISFAIRATTTDREIQLDGAQTKLTIYDAITRSKVLDVPGAKLERVGSGLVLNLYICAVQYPTPLCEVVLDSLPRVIRVDMHVVGDGFVEDKSILMPLIRGPPTDPYYCDLTPTPFYGRTRNFLVLTTADGWVQPVNATANIGTQDYPIVNGGLCFDLTVPADITLPVGPTPLIHNFVPSNKVMALGIDHAAVRIMHDSSQIATICVDPAKCQLLTTTVTTSSELTSETTSEVSFTSSVTQETTSSEQLTPPPSSAGRCVVATAAYGSEMAPEVVYMRYVRDDLVGSTATGKMLVAGFNGFYYSWSPMVAERIAGSDRLRAVFRILLLPLVMIVHVTALVFGATTSIAGTADVASVVAFLAAATMTMTVYVVLPVVGGVKLMHTMRAARVWRRTRC
jgi:hypothetical protein